METSHLITLQPANCTKRQGSSPRHPLSGSHTYFIATGEIEETSGSGPFSSRIAVIQTFVYPNAYTDHLTWGAILLLLLTRGAGVFSLDYLIDRYISRRSPAHAPR